jgi:hypothetical protein
MRARYQHVPVSMLRDVAQKIEARLWSGADKGDGTPPDSN